MKDTLLLAAKLFVALWLCIGLLLIPHYVFGVSGDTVFIVVMLIVVSSVICLMVAMGVTD